MSKRTDRKTGIHAFKRELIGLWLLGTTAVAIGLLINQLRDDRLPLVYQNKEARLKETVEKIAESSPPVPFSSEANPFPEHLSLTEFRSFVQSEKGIVLDARPEIFHRLGHVPTAISLPRDDFENAYKANRDKLESDKNTPIAIYCSGGHCEDSELVKTALVDLGFRQVSVFTGGWSEWTNAGLPEEAAQ